MSATVTKHGVNYEFGINDPDTKAIAESLGLQLISLNIKETPEFKAEAQNETGVTDGKVLGPTMATFEAEGFIRNKTLFKTASGQGFDYDGWWFIIEDVGDAGQNRDFRKGTFTGTANRGIPNPAD